MYVFSYSQFLPFILSSRMQGIGKKIKADGFRQMKSDTVNEVDLRAAWKLMMSAGYGRISGKEYEMYCIIWKKSVAFWR